MKVEWNNTIVYYMHNALYTPGDQKTQENIEQHE